MLLIENLEICFDDGRDVVRAVNGISFELLSGESLAIIGESGSGKTVSALSILDLVPPSGKVVRGRMLYRGKDLRQLPREHLSRIRGDKIAMVCQSPLSCLCPVFTVRSHLTSILRRLYPEMGRLSRYHKILELVKATGLMEERNVLSSYPFELSGGLAQKVQIAMAIAGRPDVLIVDEPTSDLDVVSQGQVLGILRDLRDRLGFSIVLITHNVAIAHPLCDKVIVMKEGRIVEEGSTLNTLTNPQTDYTRRLIEASRLLSWSSPV